MVFALQSANKASKDYDTLISEVVKRIAEEEGIPEDHIKVVASDIIPMRLQHIVRDLGMQGFVVRETVVLNGKLFLVAVRRGEKFDFAPDFEYKKN